MRAFLRADPDVIMVGEMRDAETAKIGIEASLTGPPRALDSAQQ
jgi:type II secretory ATPase GspE/PulE/Tfp pilus assembly ATPase PilB-like protein